MSTAPTLAELAKAFIRYGNLTFGGGSATIATLHGEIVERRRWLDEHPFQFSYALSRLTPGTNLLAFDAAIGWLLRGWRGAFVALIAGSVPAAVIATGLTAVFEHWSRNQVVQVGLRGALAAAVAVMLITGVTLIRPHWKSASILKMFIFVGGAFLLAQVFALAPLRVLLVAAVTGYFWPERRTV